MSYFLLKLDLADLHDNSLLIFEDLSFGSTHKSRTEQNYIPRFCTRKQGLQSSIVLSLSTKETCVVAVVVKL